MLLISRKLVRHFSHQCQDYYYFFLKGGKKALTAEEWMVTSLKSLQLNFFRMLCYF